MAANSMQVGDVGVPIRLTVYKKSDNTIEKLDLATNLLMYLQDPDGNVVSKTAVLVGDGSGGQVEYVTEAGVIDQDGTWIAQLGFTLGGFVGRSTTASFEAKDNLS